MLPYGRCEQVGASLKMLSEIERLGSGRAAERRYLSIMFVDLVGYTGLSEQLDPEDLAAVQHRYQHLALTVMERFGGFVANFAGDGILVYFGYPIAHENDAERALRAGLELLERLGESTRTCRNALLLRSRHGSACTPA